MVEATKAGSAKLHAVPSKETLYRIAHRPDPWAWPDWAYAGKGGIFENRWDDPQGVYRVLYASSTLLGALMEVLARFRPDPHVLAGLEDIEDEPGTMAQPPGELDVAWLRSRCVGTARVKGTFVDVGNSTSLAHLRTALAPLVVEHELDDLDAAAVRLSAPREFTQEISRYLYDLSTPQGQRRFAGITYASRLGDEFRNWAIFEPPDSALPFIGEPDVQSIEEDDPDLVEALERLGVRLIR